MAKNIIPKLTVSEEAFVKGNIDTAVKRQTLKKTPAVLIAIIYTYSNFSKCLGGF